jgi:cobalt-zinc-cadmium efflux system membrane fusion protein
MFTSEHGLLAVPANSPLRTHLKVETVGAAVGVSTISFPATVEADPTRVANILAPATGRIVSLNVGLGQAVRRGQLLAVIASGDAAQAEADADKARDAFALAKKGRERARGVLQAGGSAQKDFEAAESSYNQAAAELTRAEAHLRALGLQPHQHDLQIRAPQSGVVTALSVASGAQVGDTTTALMTISNVDEVFVTANVGEDQSGKVRVGEAVDIRLAAYPGQALHGRIDRLSPTLEPDTRRRKARILVANPGGRLAPNMYATVTVGTDHTGAVVVPQSALLMNNDTTSVLVEVRPWVFQRRPVRLGEESEQVAQVLAGLNAGERIVTRGGVLLND